MPERHRLEGLLAAKAAERERIMTLYRRGRATLDDVDTQLDAIAREAADLRTTVAALRTREELARAVEAQHAKATGLLTRLHGCLDEIERADDREAKRQVVELLVSDITGGHDRRRAAEASQPGG